MDDRKGKETWWRNEEVAEVIKRKKRGIRNGGKTGERRIELEKGGSTMTFCIAKQRTRENRDIIGMPCIQNGNGYLKTEIGERLEV